MTGGKYFTLKGQCYWLSKTEVEFFMYKVKPKIIRKYYIIVNRRRYPIKQVISVCCKLGYSEFGTVDAGPILTRLGFRLRWL